MQAQPVATMAAPAAAAQPASVAAPEKSSKAAEAPAGNNGHYKESHDRDLLS